MKPSRQGINVSIMGRDFSVACSPSEEDNLVDAARYLDKKMLEVQKSGKIIGVERCAIMAALNITNELLELKKNNLPEKELEDRLKSIQEKIDSAFSDNS